MEPIGGMLRCWRQQCSFWPDIIVFVCTGWEPSTFNHSMFAYIFSSSFCDRGRITLETTLQQLKDVCKISDYLMKSQTFGPRSEFFHIGYRGYRVQSDTYIDLNVDSICVWHIKIRSAAYFSQDIWSKYWRFWFKTIKLIR